MKGRMKRIKLFSKIYKMVERGITNREATNDIIKFIQANYRRRIR